MEERASYPWERVDNSSLASSSPEIGHRSPNNVGGNNFEGPSGEFQSSNSYGEASSSSPNSADVDEVADNYSSFPASGINISQLHTMTDISNPLKRKVGGDIATVPRRQKKKSNPPEGADLVEVNGVWTYICLRSNCSYSNPRLPDVERHLGTRRHGGPKKVLSCSDSKFRCPCGENKVFGRQDALIRHVRTCYKNHGLKLPPHLEPKRGRSKRSAA